MSKTASVGVKARTDGVAAAMRARQDQAAGVVCETGCTVLDAAELAGLVLPLGVASPASSPTRA